MQRIMEKWKSEEIRAIEEELMSLSIETEKINGHIRALRDEKFKILERHAAEIAEKFIGKAFIDKSDGMVFIVKSFTKTLDFSCLKIGLPDRLVFHGNERAGNYICMDCKIFFNDFIRDDRYVEAPLEEFKHASEEFIEKSGLVIGDRVI